MTLFYRYYRYSGLATLISILANIGSILAIIGAAYMLLVDGKYVLGIILAALAVFLFVYVGRILTDKLARKWGEKNIATKPHIAKQYCTENPEEYERVAAINQKFAEKYMLGANGKIVKRK